GYRGISAASWHAQAIAIATLPLSPLGFVALEQTSDLLNAAVESMTFWSRKALRKWRSYMLVVVGAYVLTLVFGALLGPLRDNLRTWSSISTSAGSRGPTTSI